MPYPKSTKNEALKRWIEGISMEQISKELGGHPSKQTLWEWYHKYNWEGKRQSVNVKHEIRLDDELTDIVATQERIARSLLGDGLKPLQKKLKKEGLSTHDTIELMRHWLLIRGKATERVESMGYITLLEELGKRLKERKNAGST